MKKNLCWVQWFLRTNGSWVMNWAVVEMQGQGKVSSIKMGSPLSPLMAVSTTIGPWVMEGENAKRCVCVFLWLTSCCVHLFRSYAPFCYRPLPLVTVISQYFYYSRLSSYSVTPVVKPCNWSGWKTTTRSHNLLVNYVSSVNVLYVLHPARLSKTRLSGQVSQQYIINNVCVQFSNRACWQTAHVFWRRHGSVRFRHKNNWRQV